MECTAHDLRGYQAQDVGKATSPNGLPFHHGLRDLLMGCVLKSLNRIPEAEKVCGMYEY